MGGTVYTARVERTHIVDRLRRFLGTHPQEIAAAWLFGSVAKGTERPDSDVDIGVLYGAQARDHLWSMGLELEGALERELGRPVQIVVMNLAPVDLAIRVLRAETLLVDRDPSARVRFEVRTRTVFFDLEPHLLRYRKWESRS